MKNSAPSERTLSPGSGTALRTRPGNSASNSRPAVIQVRGLRKVYGAYNAVDGVDLEVRQGEIYALLGPNGAGKSTTMEILEGYRRRDGGTVTVLGTDPGEPTLPWRSRIGLVLQSSQMPAELSVTELVDRYAAYYPHPRDVDETISLVGLGDKRKARAPQLSGGQLRRLDVALALVGDPELVFLDEPTTGFDPAGRRAAWSMIENLRSLGKTVMLTTHFMDEAEELADYVAIMVKGRIVAEGTPDTIGGRDRAPVEISFVTPPGVASPPASVGELHREGGLTHIRAVNAAESVGRLVDWSREARVALDGLEIRRPSLEDIYLALAVPS